MVNDKHYSKEVVDLTIAQLVQLRKSQNLSCNVLSRKACVSRVAVGYIENGKRSPSLAIMVRLATALNTDLSTVLKGAEKKALTNLANKPLA